MSFSGSNWLGSSGNWTTAADWDDAVPPTGLANNYTATLGGSGNYIVTLNSNVGTIAASGVTASTVGLTLNDVNATLIVASGGTVAIGNANGTGGLVTIDGDLQVNSGGSVSATNTLTLSNSDAFLTTNGGVASVAGLNLAAGFVVLTNEGTLTISSVLDQTGGTVEFAQSRGVSTGTGLLALGDVGGDAIIDLNFNRTTAPGSRVYWTNSATTADLANLVLKNFGFDSTLDVATNSAVTITGTAMSDSALTIDTSGGNLVVDLGSGETSQYFATATMVGAQNIVRITTGLITSNWIDGTTGNWTTAGDWDDAVPPSGAVNRYAAALGGSLSYTVTINSDIGTIAAAGASTSSDGLMLTGSSGVLDVASGGTLAVGAANGEGGGVYVNYGFSLFVDSGGRVSAAEIEVEHGTIHIFGGVASITGLYEHYDTNADVEVANEGTLAILGQLHEDNSNVIRFVGSGLISVADATSTVNLIDLNAAAVATPGSRVFWTNSATTADLGNLQLENFGTASTLDVATASAVTITGTQLAANALTIDTSGGNFVVGLGSGASMRYLARTTTIGSQNVVEITACFLRGTRIATPEGAVCVEDLRAGDAVLTRSGVSCVQWVGWRGIDCVRHPRPQDVLPVRIDPDAFGPGQPSRTLRLSPDHAVSIDGVLIPVRYLVNGATIVQEHAEAVSYWHVELPRHDILFAEGLSCESYLDTGNRGAFANGGGVLALHPDFAPKVWEAEACAELVRGGAELEAARSWLLERAGMLGHRPTRDPRLSLMAGGREVAAACDTNKRVLSARLPEGVERMRLVSRRFAPAHAHPHSDDWRELGVAVTRVWLDDIEIARDDPRLDDGWRAPEAGWRWTDGDAAVAVGAARTLQVEWAAIGRYWETPCGFGEGVRERRRRIAS